MAILAVQLSDIHFETSADLVIRRSGQVGAAIAAEVDSEVATVALLICGDIAYGGTKAQFELARQFFAAIEATITNRCPAVSIVRIVIPGNHDCNFTGDQAARESLLHAITSSDVPASSIEKVILEPLHDYFAFASEFAGASHAITLSDKYYKCVEIADSTHILRFHLVNTAWMSSKHETPGSLHFPLVTIVPPSGRPDGAIALLHHPTNWFKQPQAMRPLRDKLAALASVMLVNHEHTAEVTDQDRIFDEDTSEARTLLIAAGALQEQANSIRSTFNMIKIDLVKSSFALSRHDFKPGGPTPFYQRVPIKVFNLASPQFTFGLAGFTLTSKWMQYLEDPGAPVLHPRRDPRMPIKLSDVFIYPDLWELDAEHNGGDQKQIRSLKVFDEIAGSTKVLLTGGEKSGRTSFSKALYKELGRNGKVPLMLNGRDLPKKTSRLRDSIRKAVVQQYSNLSSDAYEQLDPSQKVILIDDIQLFAASSDVRKELLQQLEHDFSQVIVSGDDLIQLDQLNGHDGRDSGLWDYRHLVILGFGEFLREQFVGNWLDLSGDTVHQEDERRNETQRLCGILNAVIQKQLLPSYPLFLIVVLQQCDISSTEHHNGSFGHLFAGVITAILSKSQFTKIAINAKHHYLAAFAKRLFDRRQLSLPLDETKEWHATYWTDIDVKVDFDTLVNDLCTLGVLTIENDSVRFRYSYYYCFFMAYYLQHRVHEDESRTLISKLCKQLHHRLSADIVLFLANLSSEPLILQEMTKTCDSLLEGGHNVTFGGDVESLNRLSQTAQKLTIPNDSDENRIRLKLKTDDKVTERLAANTSRQDIVAPEPESELTRHLFELHAAYKSIQILGQALRNMDASAPRTTKEEVLGKILGLAKRLMGSYLAVLNQENIQELLTKIAEAHRQQEQDLTHADLFDEVCRHLYGMSQFVCFSIIKHTTSSVGSENLAPTIDRFLNGIGGVPEKVFSLSFGLDQYKKFPKDAAIKLFGSLSKNQFTGDVVRMLVAHHLYLFAVPFQDRQAVCTKLSIDVQPTVLDPKRKLLT